MGLWSRCIVDGFADGDDEVMREERKKRYDAEGRMVVKGKVSR